jgi:hypothetical protein
MVNAVFYLVFSSGGVAPQMMFAILAKYRVDENFVALDGNVVKSGFGPRKKLIKID